MLGLWHWKHFDLQLRGGRTVSLELRRLNYAAAAPFKRAGSRAKRKPPDAMSGGFKN